MKKGFFQSVLLTLTLVSSTAKAVEMKAINFAQKGEVSELEFIFDSNNAQASKFQIKEDKQIIVDFADVITSERVMRAFDTSEFSGGVVFVKAYKKPKSDKDVRIAVQLRDNVRSVLVRKQNRVVLQIENRFPPLHDCFKRWREDQRRNRGASCPCGWRDVGARGVSQSLDHERVGCAVLRQSLASIRSRGY